MTQIIITKTTYDSSSTSHSFVTFRTKFISHRRMLTIAAVIVSPMAAQEAPSPVRIAKIAGRFLVFDPEAATVLRRHFSANGVLVGTAPQQPTQNIFLGLPIELRPEEVNALVQRNAAYVVDDVAAHQHTLNSFLKDPSSRTAYIESLKRRKQAAQQVLAEQNAIKAVDAAAKQASNRKSKAKKQAAAETVEDAAGDSQDCLFSSTPEPPSIKSKPEPEVKLSVTPTQSNDLISQAAEQQSLDNRANDGPFCQHLQQNGYYMTPGLRFGAKYSVYPGDPLRYHAHFMANPYDWDEQVPVLDLVGGGRLATAVKKAFLIGGEQPATSSSDATGDAQSCVRTFSIEWAAM